MSKSQGTSRLLTQMDICQVISLILLTLPSHLINSSVWNSWSLSTLKHCLHLAARTPHVLVFLLLHWQFLFRLCLLFLISSTCNFLCVGASHTSDFRSFSCLDSHFNNHIHFLALYANYIMNDTMYFQPKYVPEVQTHIVYSLLDI